MDRLSILLSSYNRPDLLGHSIESILKCTVPEGLEIEIIIIDDMSNDETWDILNRYRDDDRFIIERNTRKSYAGGPNWSRGYSLSSGNMITNNEDDMIWHPDYIKHLYRELKEQGKYTCLFGIYIQTGSLDDMKPPAALPYDPHPRFGRFTGIPHKPTDGTGVNVGHNSFFCYKEFFEGLDEIWHHFPGSGLREETDLYLRTLELVPPRKYMAVPSAYLWHIHNRSGKNAQSRRQIKMGDRGNHVLFLKRNFGSRAYMMILAYRIYSFQKWIRDMIGYHLTERLQGKDGG